MLKSAEDKHYNGKKYRKHLTYGVLYLLVAVGCNEHEHSAEDGKNKYAQQIVIEFHGTYISRLFAYALYSGAEYHAAHDDRSRKISQPYNNKVKYVRGLVFNSVADLSREKIETEGKYHEQSRSEKERSQIFIVAGKEHRAAYSDSKACQQRT